jgi:hypothetical protein
MTQDFLEYPKMVERAMRGVVREALGVALESGLPGLHHFYITFRTKDPDVTIADRLLAQYPDEMTIVMEHQYWDLVVDDDKFSITLSFGGAPETLVIPYAAITAFVDPSVKFGLQFDANSDDTIEAPSQTEEAATSPVDGPAPDGGTERADPPADDGQVVALDSFRKK